MSLLPIEPEGPQSEWKVRLPRPERTARTLCAFANGVGGVLWVGVNDDGAVVGVHHVEKVLAELQEALHWIEPVPHITVRTQVRGGKSILRMEVAPLQDAIAHVLSRSGKNTVYLREGSSNRPASRSAARAIAQPARIQLGPKERALLTLLRGAEPMSLKQIASQLRMGERRARRLLVPLLQAGYVHDRSERRYALTAPGAAQLDS